MSKNENTTYAISRDDFDKVLFHIYRIESRISKWNEEKRERRLYTRAQAYADLKEVVETLKKYDV